MALIQSGTLIFLGLLCIAAASLLSRRSRSRELAETGDSDVIFLRAIETSDPAPQDPTVARPIKGNINARGERIYHVQGKSPFYAVTKIDPTKGERWFASEEEAQRAGWRPPH